MSGYQLILFCFLSLNPVFFALVMLGSNELSEAENPEHSKIPAVSYLLLVVNTDGCILRHVKPHWLY